MKQVFTVAFGIILAIALSGLIAANQNDTTSLSFRDSSGLFSTITTNHSFDLENPFFQVLGTNGRSCGTCHVDSDAWTITPEHIQARFWGTNGQDPLFRTNDGSNCADADVSTFAKAKQAYSLLMEKGLIRVELPIPPNAEFNIVSVDDPYGCGATPGRVSVYRRVLPGTNLRFLSTVMWDGRENAAGKTITEDLAQQIIDATTGHAAASAPPTTEQVNAILGFELGTYSAQTYSKDAGWLNRAGGQGGPGHLVRQLFYLGINDPLGKNPTGAAFDPSAFTLYKNFGNDREGDDDDRGNRRGEKSRARASIRHGEEIFNTRSFTINDVAGLPVPSLSGTCTTCHESPNVGDHSVAAPLNIGLTDESRRTPDLPLFSMYCSTTHQMVQSTDPGRALITGKCEDIGKFKGPILRALAPRAPYFHNGFAETLNDVVDFYDTRFQIGLDQQDKDDLVAFLRSL